MNEKGLKKAKLKNVIRSLFGKDVYLSCCYIQHCKITTKLITLYQSIYKFQKLYIVSRISILIAFICTIQWLITHFTMPSM